MVDKIKKYVLCDLLDWHSRKLHIKKGLVLCKICKNEVVEDGQGNLHRIIRRIDEKK